MKQAREVATCTRCRLSKRKCDKAKPNCTRCERGGTQCTYGDQQESQSSSHSESEVLAITPVTTSSSPASGGTQGVKRRRNRACVSCTRCHRLKVKCDQRQPCSRCSRSGLEAACTYTHRAKSPQQPLQPQPAPEQPQYTLTDEDPEFVVATWFLRKRGSTHYRAILNRVCIALSLSLCTAALGSLNLSKLTAIDGITV